MTKSYDAIIVGGGSNGLTCAAFLSRAGKRVLVLEAAPVVGGFATTEELTPDAPGFRYNKHAVDLFSGMIPTSIRDELRLDRYGWEVVDTDPYATYLAPDGGSICQWRDIDRTAAEIAHYSRRDAEQYKRFAKVLGDAWNAFLPILQGNPKSVRLRDFGDAVRRAAKGRRSLGTAARILVSSPDQVLNEWFERDELKVILGTWAAATGQVEMETPGSAAGMAMAVLSHRWGCYRAIGGMGAVTGSLAAFVLEHGGEIRTDTPVERILADESGAKGVRLPGGEEIRGREIVGALDPASMFTNLVDPALLPEKVRDELRGMTIGESNLTYFTGHAALSKRPTLPKHGRDEEILRAGYQMLVPSYESLRTSIEVARRGEIPEEIPIWLSYPSVCDRTLVPEGSDGETLYFMTPVTPYDLADGRDWADEKGSFMNRVLDIVEGYTAGVKESIIDSAGVTPYDMSRWTTKGHACHIDMTLSQMGPWRPTPSLAGHRTPIDGLWHVSAGSSLPSVNGWGGRAAAKSMLSRRQRRKLAKRVPRGTSGPPPRPTPETHPDRPLEESVR